MIGAPLGFNSQLASQGGNGALVNSYLLRFVFVNLNCLSNKVSYITNLLSNKPIDLFGICETWLTPEVLDAAIAIKGYKIFRMDSPSLRRKHGVAIYVKDNIKCEALEIDSPPNVIGLYLVDYKVNVLIVYRPPSNSLIENLQLINFLRQISNENEVIIMGDLNLPSIDWIGDVDDGYVTPTDRYFLDFFCRCWPHPNYQSTN